MSHGTHLQTILNQKEIRTDTSFGEVELALNWDPIGNSGSMQKRNGCVEEINFNAKQLISFRKFDIKIEKYSAEMYGMLSVASFLKINLILVICVLVYGIEIFIHLHQSIECRLDEISNYKIKKYNI